MRLQSLKTTVGLSFVTFFATACNQTSNPIPTETSKPSEAPKIEAPQPNFPSQAKSVTWGTTASPTNYSSNIKANSSVQEFCRTLNQSQPTLNLNELNGTVYNKTTDEKRPDTTILGQFTCSNNGTNDFYRPNATP